ncbi:MBG domain-containing protein [Aquisphaera insulae]|uniref:MBG domain-containing protein n=1 Tax=Aquisphaera insulae TaxID=2712864 RepID=UPI0013EE0214|nr:MBG domain-containing protein [Aquisphaera insulae]
MFVISPPSSHRCPGFARYPHARRGRRRQTPLVDSLEDRTLLSLQPTLTTIIPPAVAPVYGQAITLTAAVASSAGVPTGGTVAFLDGGDVLGTAAVVDGTAALTTAALGVGSHTISATYTGDGTTFAGSATGGILAVAGTMFTSFRGDGGPATSASILRPSGVAVDSAGNLYIADMDNNRIREVIRATGQIITVAGNGGQVYYGEGGPATEASFGAPTGVALDADGNLYIASQSGNRILKVIRATGVIVTVAGDGRLGYPDDGDDGDGGLATSARLGWPAGVAVDAEGNVFIADTNNSRVRMVSKATGVITTVAGDGSSGYAGDGGPATASRVNAPQGVAVDADGNLYIADSDNDRIREVIRSTGIITTIVGDGNPGSGGDGGLAAEARVYRPCGVMVDSQGDLFIVDSGSSRIRQVSKSTGLITTAAGSTFGYSGDAGPATAARLNLPNAVAVDALGNLFIADTNNNRIREVVKVTGRIDTVAGDGTFGFGGEGGPATEARFYNPTSVAVDPAGNLYIADTNNHRIREVVKATGIIVTIAGTGTAGYGGDGGPATAARLSRPSSITLDAQGNVYFVDQDNNRVRKVVRATGAIVTVAGDGLPGYGGDGGSATAARLSQPEGLAVDVDGNLYIADQGNNRIRKVIKDTGIIITVAGDGTEGNSGDGGPATAAKLHGPAGLALDAAGNLFFADRGNFTVRELIRSSGKIVTVAGNGTYGYAGDGGPAVAAGFIWPSTLAFDVAGNLLIGDAYNMRVRLVDRSTGLISTVVGYGIGGQAGEGGPAVAAQFNGISSLAIDAAGNLFIADPGNAIIREVSAPVTLVVSPSAPSVLLSASTESPTFGQSVTFTAMVSSSFGDAAATGTVQFAVDGATFGPAVALVGGSATSLALSSLTAGDHVVTVRYSGDANVLSAVASIPGFAVAKAHLRVKAEDQLRPRGWADPTFTASITGLVNGDSAEVVAGSPALSTTATVSSPIGAYPITVKAGTLSAANYDFEFVDGTLSVTAPPLPLVTIASVVVSPAYGQATRLTASVGSLPGGPVPGGSIQFVFDGVNLGPPVALVAGSATSIAVAPHSAGDHAIGAVYTGNTAYASVKGSGTMSVAKAQLTVIAEDQARYRGWSNPTFSAAITGFVNGDSASVVSGIPSLTTTAAVASPEGSYPITVGAGTLSAANYEFVTFIPGKLSVVASPAPALTVTPGTSSPVYGQSLAFRASLGALPGGPAPTGTVQFVVDGANYGEPIPLAGSTADSLASTTLLAGRHSIGVIYSGDSAYSGTTSDQSVIVARARLVVTADSQSRPRGAGNPTLTARIAGFVNGESSAVVSGAPVLATAATAASPAGTYPITVARGTLAAENYDFALVAGSLIVTAPSAAAVSVVPSLTSPTYGQAVAFTATVADLSGGPAPGGTVQFLVDGANFGPAVVVVNGAATSPGTSGLVAGSHTVAAVYSGDSGHDGNTASANLSVAKAPLTVTAAMTKVYGAPMPPLAVSFIGLVNGDTASDIAGAPTLVTTATAKSNAGTYPIVVGRGTLSAANYEFPTVIDGTFTVARAHLYVTAANKARKQGAANPKLTYSIGGFVNGERSKVVHGKPTLRTTAVKSSSPGIYAIVVNTGSLTAINYDFVGINGTLTVKPKGRR